MNICVIHATAGAGHKKAAEAIYNGLKAAGESVVIVDALDYTNPFFKHSYPTSYVFLVTNLPHAWQFFFYFLDIPYLQPLVYLIRRIYNGINTIALQKWVVAQNFDVIVCTHFMSAQVIGLMKKQGRIKAKVICAVTDFDVHRIWVNPGIDYYTVACDFTRDKVIGLGIDPACVHVTGIPTDERFGQSYDRAALRRKLGWDEKAFTVLIATGSFGMGPIKELIDGLGDHQLAVVCGHNKDLYQSLSSKSNARTHILGLVNNMYELMAASDVMVTKPGGLSVAEALSVGLPMVFFSAIPGQETGNIRVLKSYGAGDDQQAVPDIIRTISQFSSDDKLLDERKSNMAVLSKPHSVRDIIRVIHG